MGELITIPEKPMSPAEIKLRFRSLVGKTPFEIRKGWYPFVQGTLQAIEDALIAAGKQPQDFPEIYPVREKYGMLHLGLTCPDVPRIEQILSEAEDLSMEICIFCAAAARCGRQNGSIRRATRARRSIYWARSDEDAIPRL